MISEEAKARLMVPSQSALTHVCRIFAAGRSKVTRNALCKNAEGRERIPLKLRGICHHECAPAPDLGDERRLSEETPVNANVRQPKRSKGDSTAVAQCGGSSLVTPLL